MDDSKGETGTAPALGISLSMQYAGGRTVVFQTHVPQETDANGINAIFDRMNAVADRAEAFYAQEQARRQLEVEEKAVLNMANRMGSVEDNIRLKAEADGRRNPRISAQDEMQRKQALDTLEEGRRRVAECKAHLADLIKRAGNRDGAPSPTNL